MKLLKVLLLAGLLIQNRTIFSTIDPSQPTPPTTPPPAPTIATVPVIAPPVTTPPPSDPTQTLQSTDPAPVDPVAITTDPDIATPAGTSSEEKSEEDSLIATTTSQPTLTKNASTTTTTPTQIRASQLRAMLANNQISYTIVSALLKENISKKSTSTPQTKDITSFMTALFTKDPYLKVRKDVFTKIKSNGLSAAQNTLYQTNGITSSLALFAETMPLNKKQHAEILIQAFVKNPDPNVKMTPINYLVMMGDSRVPRFKTNDQKDNKQKDNKQKDNKQKDDQQKKDKSKKK